VTDITLYPVTERARGIYDQVARFVDTHVRPGQLEYSDEVSRATDR
jgi:hypothetical protein